MTIPDPLERGKTLLGRIPADILIISVLVLASVGSFGLGVLAGKDMAKSNPEDGLWIEQLPATVRGGGGPAAASAALSPAPTMPATVRIVPAPQGPKVYVASKSGTKYYLPTCGSVKRIKEENKVWFATKAEAEAAGYEPSTACKGL